MESVRGFVRLRYALMAVIILSLLGVAFYFGQYSVQGLAVKDMENFAQPDVKTYTKAFCEMENGVRSCVDKFVVVLEGKEYVVENSEVEGSAIFPRN